MVCSEANYGSLMCSVQLVDRVCLVWSLLVLVVDPSIVATSPPVMPNLPRLRLCDLLGCSIGDFFIALCLRGSLYLSNSSVLSFPVISQCLGIHWMDVSTSFWLCSLLAVDSMSVAIGFNKI